MTITVNDVTQVVAFPVRYADGHHLQTICIVQGTGENIVITLLAEQAAALLAQIPPALPLPDVSPIDF